MARQYAGQVTVVGVAGRDSVEKMAEFVERHGLADDTLQAADVDGQVWELHGVFAQPAWVFIGADGEQEAVHGVLGEEGLRGRVEQLLGS